MLGDIKIFENINKIQYQKDGIFPSEMIMFLSQCKKHNIDLIIESGIKYGYSTDVLLKYTDCSLHSIDINLLDITKRKYENNRRIKLYEGNSKQIVNNIIENNPSKKIACLIDGPKGVNACYIGRNALVYKNVKFVGIHDVAKEFKENREKIINDLFPNKQIFISSNEVELRKELKFDILDKSIVGKVEGTRFKNGPGLALIYNDGINL